MKTVIAIDSLKGSLTSMEAGMAIREGIISAWGDQMEVLVRPLADGGEGTIDALVEGMNGVLKEIEVEGPFKAKVTSRYGWIPNKKTAIVECAESSGLSLVPTADRNPLKTSTIGMGQVIRNAVEYGVRNFIVGLGGSATNDCGTGMLTALGYKFLDENGEELFGCGENLQKIQTIDMTNVMPELKECTFRIACDVTNPLCGELGASHIYGPQKGATPEMVEILDAGCHHFAEVTKAALGIDNEELPGAGAAGGLGYTFATFLKGELKSGIQIVLDEIRLEDDLKDADFVVTGEGRLDHQTAMGKAPIGVAKLAKKHGATVIAFAGSVTNDAKACNAAGIDAFFPILRGITTLDEAMNKENASYNMTHTAEQAFNLLKAVKFWY